jgi:hypothetical protein
VIAAEALLLLALAPGRVWTSEQDVREWLLTTDGLEPRAVSMVEQGRSFVRVTPLTVFIMTDWKLGQPYVISGARGSGLSVQARHHSPARYLIGLFFTAQGATVWEDDPKRWLSGCPIWEARAIVPDRWLSVDYDFTKAQCWKHDDIVAVFLFLATTADPGAEGVEQAWSKADYIDVARIQTIENQK